MGKGGSLGLVFQRRKFIHKLLLLVVLVVLVVVIVSIALVVLVVLVVLVAIAIRILIHRMLD